MKNIELLIRAEGHRSRSSLAYEFLGKFGNKLDQETCDDLRTVAEFEMRECEKIEKKVAKNLSN